MSFARHHSIGCLLLCGLVMFSGRSVAEAPPSIVQILETEGSFAFTDGSSIYTLGNDHAFSLQPVGISGRTITGTWAPGKGSAFHVTGTWGWVNGASVEDDHRELVFHVRCTGKRTTADGEQPILYPVYFTIERLGRVQGP